MTSLRWGLLSTAAIGRLVVGATRGCDTTELVAVASRDEVKAEAFARANGLPLAFGSYEEMLASDALDAVYVALPISLHAEWTVKALEAGKHVLCEKPFVTTAADADRCFAAAESAGRLCAEALMWRYHPQSALARELVRDGAIGDLLLVRAALTVDVPDGDIRRLRGLGGGASLDLGCYCTSALRLFGGEPRRVYAEAVHDDDGVDPRMVASMLLENGVLGQFDMGLTHTRRDQLELVGSAGSLVVPDPWIGVSAALELRRGTRSETIPVDLPAGSRLGLDEGAVYRHELDRVSRAALAGSPLPFGRADAVAQAATLEALDTSARSGSPVLSRPVHAPSGPRT
jgi:xylose dehydrogenase (NAD/NADP)